MHFDKATLNTGSVSLKRSSAAVLVTRGAPPHPSNQGCAFYATSCKFTRVPVRIGRLSPRPPTFLSQVSTTCTLSGARNFNLSGGFSGDWRKEDDHWLNHTLKLFPVSFYSRPTVHTAGHMRYASNQSFKHVKINRGDMTSNMSKRFLDYL